MATKEKLAFHLFTKVVFLGIMATFAWAIWDAIVGALHWWQLGIGFAATLATALLVSDGGERWRAGLSRKWYSRLLLTTIYWLSATTSLLLVSAYVSSKGFIFAAGVFLFSVWIVVLYPTRVFGDRALFGDKLLQSGTTVVNRFDRAVLRLSAFTAAFWLLCFVGVERVGLPIYSSGHSWQDWAVFVADSTAKGVLDWMEIFEINLPCRITAESWIDKLILFLYRTGIAVLLVSVMGVALGFTKIDASDDTEADICGSCLLY